MPYMGWSLSQHDCFAFPSVTCASDHSITDDDSVGIHSARNVINTEHEQLSEVSRNYGVKACHVAVQMPCKTETQ